MAIPGEISADLGPALVPAAPPHATDATVAASYTPSARADGWRGKRAVDVVASAVLIVLALPLLLAAALALKLTSRGPVLFRQTRIGVGDRPFTMLKLRTMHLDAEERLCASAPLYSRYLNGDHKIAIKEDPRVTRVGRFLRRSSLDELPQLFNVLAGHMSLVGPRPVTPAQWPAYRANLLACRFRPGLTGLWQVSGRNDIRFPERALVDADYCARCSPWLDLTIVAKTPFAVLSRRGAS